MNQPFTKPVRLVVEALALGNEEAPPFAIVTVTEAFIDRLASYSGMFGMNAPIQALTIDDAPDSWGSEENAPVQGDILRLWRDGDFWFEAQLNEADVVETRAIDLNTLTQIVASGPGTPSASANFCWRNGSLYFAGDPDRLEELIVSDVSGSGVAMHDRF